MTAAKRSNNSKGVDVFVQHVNREIERAVVQANWYKSHSQQAKIKYLVLRVPAIIIAVSLPQLIAIQPAYPNANFLPLITSILAGLLAILTALDTFFRYGDTYAEERACELAIYSLLRRTGDEMRKIENASSSEEGIQIAENLIASFRTEYEKIVGQAVSAFVDRTKASAAAVPSQKPSE